MRRSLRFILPMISNHYVQRTCFAKNTITTKKKQTKNLKFHRGEKEKIESAELTYFRKLLFNIKSCMLVLLVPELSQSANLMALNRIVPITMPVFSFSFRWLKPYHPAVGSRFACSIRRFSRGENFLHRT